MAGDRKSTTMIFTVRDDENKSEYDMNDKYSVILVDTKDSLQVI